MGCSRNRLEKSAYDFGLKHGTFAYVSDNTNERSI